MFSAELKWSGDIMDGRALLQTGVYYMDEDNEVDFVDYLDLGAVGVPVPPSTLFTTVGRPSTEQYHGKFRSLCSG
ncbi:MAG: hypothetical protein CM15mP74_30570 [Halieaceae bacterium]|nr:MAG: hypothetical protein CM15mP74_30570 [Halieaceae bacterium]